MKPNWPATRNKITFVNTLEALGWIIIWKLCHFKERVVYIIKKKNQYQSHPLFRQSTATFLSGSICYFKQLVTTNPMMCISGSSGGRGVFVLRSITRVVVIHLKLFQEVRTQFSFLKLAR